MLDKDPSIASSFKNLAIQIATLVGTEEILGNVSNEARSLLKPILPAAEEVTIVSPLASPTIETTEIALAPMEEHKEKSDPSAEAMDEIIVDSEITMRIRTKRSPPCTPKTLSKSISVVDFDTPRSTAPETHHETDPVDTEINEANIDEIIEDYSNPLAVEEPVNAIKQLELSS